MSHTTSIIARQTQVGFTGYVVTNEATVAYTVRSLWRVYRDLNAADIGRMADALSYDEPLGVPDDIASRTAGQSGENGGLTAAAAIKRGCEYAYVFGAGQSGEQELRVLVALWRRGRLTWTNLATVDLDGDIDPAWDALDGLALAKVAASVGRP